MNKKVLNMHIVKAIRNQRGFSLLEILMAITLLGIVGTIVGLNLIDRLEDGKVGTANLQMASFGAALKEYRRKCGAYPTTEQGLDALIANPGGGGRECKNYPPNGFLSDEFSEIPNDPWDEPYYYESEGRRFQIYSLGADNTEGGEGFEADLYYPARKE